MKIETERVLPRLMRQGPNAGENGIWRRYKHVRPVFKN